MDFLTDTFVKCCDTPLYLDDEIIIVKQESGMVATIDRAHVCFIQGRLYTRRGVVIEWRDK